MACTRARTHRHNSLIKTSLNTKEKSRIHIVSPMLILVLTVFEYRIQKLHNHDVIIYIATSDDVTSKMLKTRRTRRCETVRKIVYDGLLSHSYIQKCDCKNCDIL